jgi:hypothetical protein
VIVADEAPVEIGGQQLVVEHEQATGKLVQVLIGVERVRCGLPTGVPCTAGAEEDGGSEVWFGRSELDSGIEGIERRDEGNAAAREKEGVKALGWAVHGDEEVAAGGGSGSSWRAREARKGEERGRGREGTTRGKVNQQEVELGARRRRSAAEAEQSREREAAVLEVEEAGRSQKDLFVISKEFRDPSVN